ncbi:hypothetical protein BPNPMPFG_000464 [Mesorhizobium sp. AR07]|uniref:hypothetical protein n=1 Tax=Mesorhizobium sp. AR07 TaxID=2865838 RepID=UPI002160B2C6|nr:hypothetical protein [Mesorhizobium sp. AR07]UVK44983.1 hypothetical protein BPNPMPFG_000464 [Mesorhizobium sp. AR07]
MADAMVHAGARTSVAFTALNAKVTLNDANAVKTGRSGLIEGMFNIAAGSFARLDVFARLPTNYAPRKSTMAVLSTGEFGSVPVRITTAGDIILEGALTIGAATYGNIVCVWIIDT